MTSSELITVSVNIGTALLKSGAEIYRVEESIIRICYTYGAIDANVYAVPTAIITSFRFENEQPVSRVRRIRHRETNLGKLDRYNSLCREICASHMSYEEICQRLLEISNYNPFSNWQLCLATGGVGLFFTLLFSGSWSEAFCAFVSCILLWFLTTAMHDKDINLLFSNVVSGSWISFSAILFRLLGIIADYRIMIVGSIMVLVPGLLLTNAIRDIIAGDLMAGIGKLAEAFIVAVGIAVGVALPLSIQINIQMMIRGLL